ncbi:hypothetical protein A9Q78_00285 [Methylophaga sp. 41_12_T18]|nr:hypothetical protein A9Q78_00285 [Methylophaga sp. 41_12_T18]
MTGQVSDILIAAQTAAACQPQSVVTAHAGKGLFGDRYYAPQGSIASSTNSNADFEITLIDQAHIDAFNQQSGQQYSGADFRRNIVTTGIDLNQFEGQEFIVGEVRLKGISLCEPCAFLADLLGKDVVKLMLHKAGLRAQILNDGKIQLSDKVTTI